MPGDSTKDSAQEATQKIQPEQVYSVTLCFDGVSGSKGTRTTVSSYRWEALIPDIEKITGLKPIRLFSGTNEILPKTTVGDIAQRKSKIPITVVADTFFAIECVNAALTDKEKDIAKSWPSFYGFKASLHEGIMLDEKSQILKITKTVPERFGTNIKTPTINTSNTSTITIEHKEYPEETRQKAIDALGSAIKLFDQNCGYEFPVDRIGLYQYDIRRDDRKQSGMEIRIDRTAIYIRSYEPNNFFKYIATSGVEAMLRVLDPGFDAEPEQQVSSSPSILRSS